MAPLSSIDFPRAGFPLALISAMIDPALWCRWKRVRSSVRRTRHHVHNLAIGANWRRLHDLSAVRSGNLRAAPLRRPVCAFAALHAGASYESALLLGLLAFLLVVMLGQMVAQLLPFRHGRIVIALLFALPAGVAGFQVADALLHLGGVGSWGVALSLAAALATGTVAAKRYQRFPGR